jgi:tight adherence protein C
MTLDLALPLALLFISIALGVGSLASLALTPTSAAKRRLQPTVGTTSAPVRVGFGEQLKSLIRPARDKANQLAKSPMGKSSRLQRRMEMAGWTDPDAAGYYSLAETILPIICGLLPLAVMGTRGWALALICGALGYLIPDVILSRATRKHQKAIQNGLPDAIDLIVVCVEAGSSLDQAIMRASDELDIALPALARELRTVTNEIRAGKPRLEAFQGLAKRTQVDDVRSLVSMLTQTDRFGTSIAQALRTHAATSRTKRRQRAEERAAKVGVKLVFPLALCLVPALYVVCLGPVVIRIMRALT